VGVPPPTASYGDAVHGETATGEVTRGHVKRRPVAEPGSIPDVLDMFRNEVRFYREVAPVIGVRVPACYRSEDNADGTLLVLEDLSDWAPGANPPDFAAILAGMHRRWAGATGRWPWLRRGGTGSDLIEALYDETWPHIVAHPSLTGRVRDFGTRLIGRVAAAEIGAANAGPLTLCHGDASTQNVRTGHGGELALLDWEDVGAAAGIGDLAWLLVSSVEPDRWDETIGAYGAADRLSDALPAMIVQGLLSLADAVADASPEDTEAANAWGVRLDTAVERVSR
jgi:hypothetical protein